MNEPFKKASPKIDYEVYLLYKELKKAKYVQKRLKQVLGLEFDIKEVTV